MSRAGQEARTSSYNATASSSKRPAQWTFEDFEATITELNRKLDERGRLLRLSEELRGQMTLELNELRDVNAQLRYLSTPASFQDNYLVRVRGTPPSLKVRCDLTCLAQFLFQWLMLCLRGRDPLLPTAHCL